jgi:hypothetical protein
MKYNLRTMFKALTVGSIITILISGQASAQVKSVGGSANAKSNAIQKPAIKGSQSNIDPARNNAASKSAPNPSNRNTVSDNRVGNNTNVGNKVNVDNSKKNVNVNIDNSKDVKINNTRNTAVRHTNNYRPYPRPPYRYGGHVYFCYHPYYYHPYRPFVWGPMWHPWGFFVATLATTAIIVSIVDNDLPDYPVAINSNYPGSSSELSWIESFPSGPNVLISNNMEDAFKNVPLGQDYYYDEGIFYQKMDGGYTVVAGPVGATVPKLPNGYEMAKLDDGTTNYYYAGTFYEKTSKGYTVVSPTAGTVVEHLPDGGEEVKMGDITYVKLGEIYFQPIQQDGKNVYEIASVEEDK